MDIPVFQCSTPASRPGQWLEKHGFNIKMSQQENCEVVLIGDSIIANLQYTPLWKDKFKNKFNIVNFGIGGDRVEHVLYRILNGEIGKEETKIVVLMVGTNNTSSKPIDIYMGILECIKQIHDKCPKCHIILPTLLPKGATPNKYRSLVDAVNIHLLNIGKDEFSKEILDSKRSVHVVAINNGIVDSNGAISDDLMHDYLHLTDKGYVKCFTKVYQKIWDVLHQTSWDDEQLEEFAHTNKTV